MLHYTESAKTLDHKHLFLLLLSCQAVHPMALWGEELPRKRSGARSNQEGIPMSWSWNPAAQRDNAQGDATPHAKSWDPRWTLEASEDEASPVTICQ